MRICAPFPCTFVGNESWSDSNDEVAVFWGFGHTARSKLRHPQSGSKLPHSR
jgi:hypothetical protein